MTSEVVGWFHLFVRHVVPLCHVVTRAIWGCQAVDADARCWMWRDAFLLHARLLYSDSLWLCSATGTIPYLVKDATFASPAVSPIYCLDQGPGAQA